MAGELEETQGAATDVAGLSQVDPLRVSPLRASIPSATTKRNIWGNLPADPRALRLSIEELARAEGLCLYEIENEVSYLESVDLVLHEVKRLRWRPIATAPTDGTIVLGYGPHQMRGHYIDAVHCWNALGRPVWTITYMDGYGAPTHWMPLPPAPCDGSGDSRQDAQRLDPKDDSAVPEGQAPNPTPTPQAGEGER